MNRSLLKAAPDVLRDLLAQAAKAARVKEGREFFLILQEETKQDWGRSAIWPVRMTGGTPVIRQEEVRASVPGHHVADTIRNRIAFLRPRPNGRIRNLLLRFWPWQTPPPIFLVKRLPTGTYQLVLVGFDQQPRLKKGRKVVIEVTLASLNST